MREQHEQQEQQEQHEQHDQREQQESRGVEWLLRIRAAQTTPRRRSTNNSTKHEATCFKTRLRLMHNIRAGP